MSPDSVALRFRATSRGSPPARLQWGGEIQAERGSPPARPRSWPTPRPLLLAPGFLYGSTRTSVFTSVPSSPRSDTTSPLPRTAALAFWLSINSLRIRFKVSPPSCIFLLFRLRRCSFTQRMESCPWWRISRCTWSVSRAEIRELVKALYFSNSTLICFIYQVMFVEMRLAISKQEAEVGWYLPINGVNRHRWQFFFFLESRARWFHLCMLGWSSLIVLDAHAPRLCFSDVFLETSRYFFGLWSWEGKVHQIDMSGHNCVSFPSEQNLFTEGIHFNRSKGFALWNIRILFCLRFGKCKFVWSAWPLKSLDFYDLFDVFVRNCVD